MKKVLYITYNDMNSLFSGSKVRPKKMYDALIKRGCIVQLLDGEASKKNKQKRIENIRKIDIWLDNNTPDFCYIESPSDPIIFKEDRLLIKKIHKKGIKIGYFYRDAYYKFGKKFFFEDKLSLKQSLKFLYYKFLSWRDDMLIKKYVDVVFVASPSAKKVYKYKDTIPLPPGGEYSNIKRDSNAKDLIYVGGISNRYGINTLLGAMKIINETRHINLNLVCRKNEMFSIPQEYLQCEWLKIYNVSGKELIKIYQKSKIALMPLKVDVYNNMALPIKLYEYLSYSLPIVSTNITEVKAFIEKYNIGLVSTDNDQDFALKILELYDDEKLYELFVKNIKIALDDNRWINRVDKIINELSN